MKAYGMKSVWLPTSNGSLIRVLEYGIFLVLTKHANDLHDSLHGIDK